MIWIVGEYAERIDNADELLESFLEGFHDESTQVSSHLYICSVIDLLGKISGKIKGFVRRCGGGRIYMHLVLCSFFSQKSDLF